MVIKDEKYVSCCAECRIAHSVSKRCAKAHNADDRHYKKIAWRKNKSKRAIQ